MLIISDMNRRLLSLSLSDTLFAQIQNQVSHLNDDSKGFARNLLSRHQPVDILTVFFFFSTVVNSIAIARLGGGIAATANVHRCVRSPCALSL